MSSEEKMHEARMQLRLHARALRSQEGRFGIQAQIARAHAKGLIDRGREHEAVSKVKEALRLEASRRRIEKIALKVEGMALKIVELQAMKIIQNSVIALTEAVSGLNDDMDIKEIQSMTLGLEKNLGQLETKGDVLNDAADVATEDISEGALDSAEDRVEESEEDRVALKVMGALKEENALDRQELARAKASSASSRGSAPPQEDVDLSFESRLNNLN